MIILGLDPGTAITGYGLIQAQGNRIRGICYGVIRTPADQAMSKRLLTIFDEVGEIMDRFRPDQVAVEEVFFGRNVSTAITVGQARGILLLQAERRGLPLGEYTPMQVKQALVGTGAADKAQVQYMVQNYLQLDDIPRPDDAADALAIAICHAHCSRVQGRYAL